MGHIVIFNAYTGEIIVYCHKDKEEYNVNIPQWDLEIIDDEREE